ncbi:E3 ubiquitin-protein ligase RNF213 isoform X3 [Xenopus laevis]|uniref:E3 ubiquitin-protein ligase RNF213 isoform X3 n=1 Tax=Xenopus laevis TaxID=8355 RepID=A0A8J1LKI6_XENLA|nr:E3 ubiquitin-protein ligase RNF213 isoform X3 [Xenopus laevis]
MEARKRSKESKFGLWLLGIRNDDTKPALTFENKSKHGETPSIEIASTTVSDEAEDKTTSCCTLLNSEAAGPCRSEDESTDAKEEEEWEVINEDTKQYESANEDHPFQEACDEDKTKKNEDSFYQPENNADTDKSPKSENVDVEQYGRVEEDYPYQETYEKDKTQKKEDLFYQPENNADKDNSPTSDNFDVEQYGSVEEDHPHQEAYEKDKAQENEDSFYEPENNADTDNSSKSENVDVEQYGSVEEDHPHQEACEKDKAQEKDDSFFQPENNSDTDNSPTSKNIDAGRTNNSAKSKVEQSTTRNKAETGKNKEKEKSTSMESSTTKQGPDSDRMKYSTTPGYFTNNSNKEEEINKQTEESPKDMACQPETSNNTDEGHNSQKYDKNSTKKTAESHPAHNPNTIRTEGKEAGNAKPTQSSKGMRGTPQSKGSGNPNPEETKNRNKPTGRAWSPGHSSENKGGTGNTSKTKQESTKPQSSDPTKDGRGSSRSPKQGPGTSDNSGEGTPELEHERYLTSGSQGQAKKGAQKWKEKKSQEQMREISGTSSNGGKPVKGGTTRLGDPADLISVFFHVLVSKDFKINPENVVVVKAAQVEGYRDWTDTVCHLYPQRDHKGYLLYEGRTEISKKNLDKYIPYKYVICHEKKEEEYELIYKNDCKAGIIVDRCLHIPSKLLSNQREWHQYDDVCMKRDDGYINKAYTFIGWNKSTIFEGKKLAGNIMLDGIFSLLTDCDSSNLSSFLNQLHQFYYVLFNSLVFEDEPTAWKSHGFGEKELINLIMGKLYQHLINKNLSAVDAIIKDRLMAGLLCAKLIETYSLPADKDSLVKVCRLLSLEQMLNKNLPIQLEELKRIFSVYEGIEYSLKLFCMRCIDGKIEDWVQILPVYHTFNTPAKPEDSTQLKPEENWAGLDGLPYQTIVIRSKFYNRDVQKYMRSKESLQQAGRTLHRSWLCLLPLENLFTFLDTIPTDFRDAFTAAWYKFHTQSSSSKDKHIEKILTKLLNMAKGPSQGSLQKDSIYLCNISLKLHHLICTQTGLNKNSQLPLLSFKIALKLFGAAQKQEPMKGRETSINEVQSNLNKAVEMLKTWLQDFFGHRFNFRRYGYPTFGDELEFWNNLLMNDDNMDLKWKELLLSDLARKIKEESPVEQIKIFCREHSLLQRLHISIEECFEECAINAVHNAYKSHNNILNQISINNLQHFRKLVSTIIRNSWPKDVQGNPTENNNEILKHMLHWKDFTHIFKLYDPNQPITSQFIEETQKLVTLSDSVLLDTVCRLMHGDILYEHLKLVLGNKNQFLDICRLRETIKVEDVKKVLEWRNEELKTVNCKKTWVENLLKTCQNISKSVRVNTEEIQQILSVNLGAQKLNDLLPVKTLGATEPPEDKVTLFNSFTNSIMSMAESLHTHRHSHVFRMLWNEAVSSLSKRDENLENEEDDELTLDEMQESLFTPCFDKYTKIYEDIRSEEVTFEVLDTYFKTFKNHYQALHKELQTIRQLDPEDNGSWVSGRIRKIEQYHQLREAFESAQIVDDIRDFCKLLGDFKTLNTLQQFGADFSDYKEKPLSFITEDIVKTKEALCEITQERAEALKEALMRKEFIKWVRNSLEDVNELKVFVDLASISAGENDMDVDRVAQFHDAVLGYAPILYELKEEFGFNELMLCLKKLWKALESDPNLQKKLRDSARHIEWLKTVKESHGSVELSSLSLASVINQRGIYIIQEPNENLKINPDSVLRLEIPDDDLEQNQVRTFNLEELKELLSKLMLMSGKGDQGNAEVEKFSEIFSNVQRLAKAYIDLCLSGDILFKTWEATIYCSDEIDIAIRMKFKVTVTAIGEIGATGNIFELLPKICQTMEDILEKRQTFMDEKRSQHYFLNYYTAEQLVFLSQQIQKPDVSEELLVMLSFIKPECTKSDTQQALLAARRKGTSKLLATTNNSALFNFKKSTNVQEKLQIAWKYSMDCMNNLFPGCLDINTLGRSLTELAKKENSPVTRSLHPSLKPGCPNLVLCASSEILSSALAVYMQNLNQPLPSYDEVLLCSPKTTYEEVALFLRRCFTPGYSGKKIYSLLYAEDLSYDTAYRAEQLFYQLQKTKGLDYHLVIICDRERHHLHIPSTFSQYKVQVVPQRLFVEVQKYLLQHFTIDPNVVSAASVFKGVSVGIVTSKRAGVGKSLYVKRLYERLKLEFPNEKPLQKIIRMFQPQVDENKVLQKLLPFLTKENKNVPIIFHIDITSSVNRGISEFLFKLLILQYLKDDEGRMWKRQSCQLYLIEILESSCIISEKQKKPAPQMAQNIFMDFFPKISCCSPNEVLTKVTENQTGQNEDPGMDRKEFESECFQRPFQYLIRFEGKQSLDKFTYKEGSVEGNEAKCLQLFLLHCGVMDPSWAELRNFAWFLNVQLKDSENSVFCKPEFVEDAMQGFKNFVVDFMILMAKDFATPSLQITDESPGRQTCEEVCTNDGDLAPFQIRKKWEAEPHPYIFFNDDRMTITFIGFHLCVNSAGNVDAINPRDKSIIKKNIMTRQLYRDLMLQKVQFDIDFDTLPREEKINMLSRVLGINKPQDPDETYELTMDNTLKILAITMRFRCGIPVVIMGETGCGKTRLIKFICKLWKGNLNAENTTSDAENMKLVKVHGGTSAESINKNVLETQAIALTNKQNKCDTVLFFDEANTTQAISSIKEVLCDHTVDGLPLIENSGLQVIAACNPYRRHTEEMIRRLESAGLGYRVKADETNERLGSIPLRQLVYRVHPLPPSIMPLVWDFGQLNNETEKKYIQQIVQHLANEIEMHQSDTQILTNVLSASQSYMRNRNDECSFVSLRDVERCVEVFRWFYRNSDLLQANIENKKAWSLVLAIGVCYHASLEKKDAYRKAICQYFPEPYRNQRIILEKITSIQDLFLDRIQIRDNIARNLALKENLFMMVICIELRIPLFLVGKPGSSKSLSKTIVADAMQGQASHTELYKHLKQIHLVSFQCSPHSTPEGIIGTFRHCARFQKDKNLNEYASVVVLDEIGLAEDSPKMPLKTLHPLLEDGCIDDETSPYKKVGFIGISNWALDPAKMNRGLFVSRGDPDQNELIESAKGICSSDLLTIKEIDHHFKSFSDAYLKLCEKQDKEFFGLRDFYSLIKMVFTYAKHLKNEPTQLEIATAILRNFSGKDDLDALSIFITNQEANTYREEIKIMDLVMENIRNESADIEARYLLLLTRNYAALQILQQTLAKENQHPEIIFGSSFPKDQEYTQICRNINRVKICMETGQMVVLLNLQNLYESLYDALNQYYVYLAGQKYVDLGLGTHRVKCRVHPKFRLIVIEEKEIVYRDFPIPLINRLEKHYLDLNTVLERGQRAAVEELNDWVKDFTAGDREQLIGQKQDYKPADVLIGYHSDTCASVLLQITGKLKEECGDSDLYMAEVKEEAKATLLNCATPDAVIRLGRKELVDEYFNKQKHGSLVDFVKSHIHSGSKHQIAFTEITTFSRLLMSIDKRILEAETKDDVKSVEVLSLQQFDTEHSFLKKIRSFLKDSTGNKILIIQSDFEDGSQGAHLVASAKYATVNEINNLKKDNTEKTSTFVYFITKLPRIQGGSSYVGFHGGLWQSVHIDDLKEPSDKLPDVTALQNMTISQLFYGATAESQLRYVDGMEGGTDASYDTEPDQIPEVVNTTFLIRSCIQSAVGMITDEENTPSRSTRRIEILVNLLSTEDNLRASLLQTLKVRVYEILKNQEENSYNPNEWLVRAASNLDALQEAGTFRYTLWKRIQAAVIPIFAHLIYLMDCDANLEILVNPETEDFLKSLWIYIFKNKNLLNISSSLGNNSSQTIKATNYMNLLFCEGNSVPFSWRIKDYLEEITAQAQYIDSVEGPEMKFVNMFSNVPLGQYINNMEENDQQKLFQYYKRDFLLLTVNISSRDELKFLEISLSACIEEFRRSKEGEELTLPWVHLAYHHFQHRFQIFSRIVAISPTVLERMNEGFQEIEEILTNQMAIDIWAGFECLDILEATILDPNPQAWLNEVKNLQLTIELICSEKYLEGESDWCTQTVEQIRTMWHCIYAIALFTEHVILDETLQNPETQQKLKEQTIMFGQHIKGFPEIKSIDPYKAVIEVIKMSREAVAESLSREDNVQFQQNCNGFFIDILCTRFFEGNSPPDKEVVDQLLSSLFITGSENDGNDLSPFTAGTNENPAIRSVILKMLLKYSFEETQKYIQDHLIRIQGSNLTTEIHMLFINCLEDCMYERFQALREEDKLHYLKDQGEFLRNFLQNGHPPNSQETMVGFLQDLAKVRFALNAVAELLSEPDNVVNEKREFLQSGQHFCEHSANDWYRVYLIRKMGNESGSEYVQNLSKDEEFRWLFPHQIFGERENNANQLDRFLVHKDGYRELREGVGEVIVSRKEESLQQRLELDESSAKEQAVYLLLAIFSEVTMRYREANRVVTQEETDNLRNFIQNTNVLQEQSIQQFSQSLLTNCRPLVRVAPDMTSSHYTIVSLAVHLGAVLLSTDNDLFQPLRNLAFSPDRMQQSFLPTMPQDMLNKAREVLGNETWYVCDNNHYVPVPGCGMPMSYAKCLECGIELGGVDHKTYKGMRKLEQDIDETGHILGAPETPVSVAAEDRGMSAPVFNVLRLVTHLAMLLGAEQNRENVKTMVKPGVEDIGTFLFRHLEKNLEQVKNSLGESVDNTATVLHLVFCRMLTISNDQPDQPLLPFNHNLSTKDVRSNWERNMAASVIAPVLTNLNQDLDDVNNYIRNDKRISSDPIIRIIYGEPLHNTDIVALPEDGLIPYSKIWSCRTRITVGHLQHMVEQKDGVNNLPMLSTFLKDECELRLVKFLPEILNLQKELVKRFQNFRDVNKQTIGEFLTSIPVDGARRVFEKRIQTFLFTWNCLRHSLLMKGEIKLPEEACASDLTLASDFAILLPSRQGQGLCATALVSYLIALHNSLVYAVRRFTRDEQTYSIGAAEAMDLHVISYEVETDLMPIILSNCQYNTQRDGKALEEIDLQRIQRQIISRFLQGKPRITLVGLPTIVHSQDRNYENIFRDVREKVLQDPLPNSAIENISKDLDLYSDVCDALQIIETMLGFLATSGGNPDLPLTTYVEDVLQMKDQSDENILEALKQCHLKHTISLWQLLTTLQSEHRIRLKNDPFADLDEGYKQELDEESQKLLTAFLAQHGLNVFLLELHEMIILKLKKQHGANDFQPAWGLREVLGPLLDGKEQPFPALEEDFPEQICLAHCVESWKVAAAMKWKRH